jgi:hypothetical protein
MLFRDWIKQNAAAAGVAVAMVLFGGFFLFNYPIRTEIIAVKIVRNWNAPTRHPASSVVTFVELPDGRVARIKYGPGSKFHRLGESIKVRHVYYFLAGEIFELFE